MEGVKFDEKGLVPAVVQDAETGEVLMVAYMNEESLQQTITSGETVFFSRSRNCLWKKGETSGHVQKVKEIRLDCDGDCLLVRVEQTGAACHTDHISCFFRALEEGEWKEAPVGIGGNQAAILYEVYRVICDRRDNPVEGSYTNYLLEKGIDKILKKVGEESAESIIAAKNRSKDEVTYEVADLFYHLMVMLVEQGVKPDDIFEELKRRR